MSPVGVVQIALILAAAYPIALLASWVDALKTPAAATADSPTRMGGAGMSAPAVEDPAEVERSGLVSGRGGYLPWDD